MLYLVTDLRPPPSFKENKLIYSNCVWGFRVPVKQVVSCSVEGAVSNKPYVLTYWRTYFVRLLANSQCWLTSENWRASPDWSLESACDVRSRGGGPPLSCSRAAGGWRRPAHKNNVGFGLRRAPGGCGSVWRRRETQLHCGHKTP